MSKLIDRLLKACGYRLIARKSAYDEAGLISLHDHSFQDDPEFRAAYERGAQVLGKDTYRWRWRVHVGLWAASTAARLPGDFVECGVNYGFLSSAIMHYLHWNDLDKEFYLLDTFAGFDESRLLEEEIQSGALENNRKFLESGHYNSNVDRVRKNFSEWKRARVVVGSVPDTLPQVTSSAIAYLHLDMNCAAPEIAALEYFWDRLTPGACVLMDDYAHSGFSQQKQAFDAFATEKGVRILAVPTGQGLLIRPPYGSP